MQTLLKEIAKCTLDEDIDSYFKREVLPYNENAWIDKKKTKVGYEIPFTRYFYKYIAPEKADDIKEDILAIEEELNGALKELFEEVEVYVER